MLRPAEARRSYVSSLLKASLCIFWLLGPAWLNSQTISGTVEDSSGAVIAEARIEITGGDLAQPLVLSSDAVGQFASAELKPGTYSVRVTHDGFEPLIKTVDLHSAVSLQFTLAIAKPEVNISVAGRSLAFANSDPVYRQLREVGLGQTFRFDNFTLTWDAATFHFQKGTLTLLTPVNGVVTGAIFIGEGQFNLKPVTNLDARELTRRTGAAEFNEDFSEAVFRFTRDVRLKFLPGLGRVDTTDASAVFRSWKEKMRQRREIPLGFMEYLLQGERQRMRRSCLLDPVREETSSEHRE